MERFPCPHLHGLVELSEERERHILERHPELLPQARHRIAQTLADPESVRRWIITAYVARRLVGGEIEWQRS